MPSGHSAFQHSESVFDDWKSAVKLDKLVFFGHTPSFDWSDWRQSEIGKLWRQGSRERKIWVLIRRLISPSGWWYVESDCQQKRGGILMICIQTLPSGKDRQRRSLCWVMIKCCGLLCYVVHSEVYSSILSMVCEIQGGWLIGGVIGGWVLTP